MHPILDAHMAIFFKSVIDNSTQRAKLAKRASTAKSMPKVKRRKVTVSMNNDATAHGDPKEPHSDGDTKEQQSDGDTKEPESDGDTKEPQSDGSHGDATAHGDIKEAHSDGVIAAAAGGKKTPKQSDGVIGATAKPKAKAKLKTKGGVKDSQLEEELMTELLFDEIARRAAEVFMPFSCKSFFFYLFFFSFNFQLKLRQKVRPKSRNQKALAFDEHDRQLTDTAPEPDVQRRKKQ